MCLDRVPHVHDNFCEISMLTGDDFEETPGPNLNDSSRGTVREQVLFVIHYVQLARTGTTQLRPFSAALQPSLPMLCMSLWC